ncbi:hypothetical protein Droror1_Dr00021946 [Drosera rotundifolia]
MGGAIGERRARPDLLPAPGGRQRARATHGGRRRATVGGGSSRASPFLGSGWRLLVAKIRKAAAVWWFWVDWCGAAATAAANLMMAVAMVVVQSSGPDFFQLKNCSPFILELKLNHEERPPAAGDTGGSSFSSLVRVRERQWLARSAAVSAAGSSPGAGRSATCAGSNNRRQRATVGGGSSARVSVSGQRLASLGGEDKKGSGGVVVLGRLVWCRGHGRSELDDGGG